MNGVHDLGGLQDMGAIRPEADEPVFHAPWEGRVFGIDRSLRAIGRWSLDAWRHKIEQIPPIAYLSMSYYERWLRVNEELAVEHGLVTPAELASGRADPMAARTRPALSAAVAREQLGRGIPSSREPGPTPRFKAGQEVRARNINPPGHTRLPRYARGKLGVVALDHGVYLLPDAHAHGLGERRQHVYSIRFTARELWGAAASPRDTVYLDLWDDHLERPS
jgi:nitrile hydratase